MINLGISLSLLMLSPLTSHVSRLTSEVSGLRSQVSGLTSHLSPLTSHLSPLTSHLSPLISHVLLLPLVLFSTFSIPFAYMFFVFTLSLGAYLVAVTLKTSHHIANEYQHVDRIPIESKRRDLREGQVAMSVGESWFSEA